MKLNSLLPEKLPRFRLFITKSRNSENIEEGFALILSRSPIYLPEKVAQALGLGSSKRRASRKIVAGTIYSGFRGGIGAEECRQEAE